MELPVNEPVGEDKMGEVRVDYHSQISNSIKEKGKGREPPNETEKMEDSEVMEKGSMTSKVDRSVGKDGGVTESSRKAMMVVALDSMEDETERGIVRQSLTIVQQKEEQLATAAKLGILKMANKDRPSSKPPSREDALTVVVELSTKMTATNFRVLRSPVV